MAVGNARGISGSMDPKNRLAAISLSMDNKERAERPGDTPTATLAQRIADLEQQLAALRREQRDRADAEFVAALAKYHGRAIFSAEDVIAHAAVDPDLREVIPPETRAMSLGQRLKRLAGRRIGAFTLWRCDGRDGRGCIWEIEIHDDAGHDDHTGR
jgi:hypothetical protein